MGSGLDETDSRAGADFYARLPVFDHFSQLTDPGLYMPVPDDWVLGLSDIVNSTSAIATGRYKEVNTAAAAVIAVLAAGPAQAQAAVHSEQSDRKTRNQCLGFGL